MRVLMIGADSHRCAQVRSRLARAHPQAQLVLHDPSVRGDLAPEFLAQGFDAVLLSRRWSGGDGLLWARELTGRCGFAPVVLLYEGSDPEAARAAAALGAASLSGAELEGEAFTAVLRQAQQRQRQARALWHDSGAGRDDQRFGEVFIRGYRCIRRLGRGVSTELFLAESQVAGGLVALKVARDRHGEALPGFDPFQRFLQEYELARRVGTRAVVRCHTLGVSDEHAWLVMEYFPRGDLRRHMRRGLTPRSALQLAGATAAALAELHAAQVLHRDLKPGNIMLREDSSVALIDFGLSKDAALELDLTDSGQIFGTPHYMSPEQGHAEPIDERSDLYSLGVILFEMLTGSKPYRADNPMAIVYKHRKEPVPVLPPGCAFLQPLLQRLLAKQPQERYASAQQACAALRAQLARWPAGVPQ